MRITYEGNKEVTHAILEALNAVGQDLIEIEETKDYKHLPNVYEVQALVKIALVASDFTGSFNCGEEGRIAEKLFGEKSMSYHGYIIEIMNKVFDLHSRNSGMMKHEIDLTDSSFHSLYPSLRWEDQNKKG